MWNDFTLKESTDAPMFVVEDSRAVTKPVSPRGQVVFGRGELRAADPPQKKSVNFGHVIILNESAAGSTQSASLHARPNSPSSSPTTPSKPRKVKSPAKVAASIYTSIGTKMIKRKPRAVVSGPSHQEQGLSTELVSPPTSSSITTGSVDVKPVAPLADVKTKEVCSRVCVRLLCRHAFLRAHVAVLRF
jgi:hypothetical protein